MAQQSGLWLRSHDEGGGWHYDEGWPHIATFEYRVSILDEDEFRQIGTVDGYRITHDWTVRHDLSLLEEADALSGDAEEYVSALLDEFEACEAVFGVADPHQELALAQSSHGSSSA